MQTVLTIAGFDPSSGAGVTADLKVFAAHGLFGTSCITALTVQSTLGVIDVHPVDPAILHDTLQYLDMDMPPAGIKIGVVYQHFNMLSISKYINILKASHQGTERCPVVLDPVFRSSSGKQLVTADALVALKKHLLPAVDWITPNRAELEVLSGQTISRHRDIPEACRTLLQQVAQTGDSPNLGIIATGGHLDPPNDYMLAPEGEEHWFPGNRIETASTHGTGCAFSSAFLCNLVLGQTPYDACVAAKVYVAGALQHGIAVGQGISPINHLWNLQQVKDP